MLQRYLEITFLEDRTIKLPFNRIKTNRPGFMVFENSPEYQEWIEREKTDKKNMPDLGMGVKAVAEHYHTKDDMKEGFIDRADKQGNYDTPDKDVAISVVKQLLPLYERGITNRLPANEREGWQRYALKMLVDESSKDYKAILVEVMTDIESAKPEMEFVPRAERLAKANGTFQEPTKEDDPFAEYTPKKNRKAK